MTCFCASKPLECAHGARRRSRRPGDACSHEHVGDETIGQTISVAGEHLTGAQMAEKLTKALGEPVRYNEVDPDTFRSFGKGFDAWLAEKAKLIPLG